MLRNVLTPTLLAAVVVKESSSKNAKSADPNDTKLAHYKCKLSDLPMYTPLHSHNEVKFERHPAKSSATRETIEGGIRVVREEVQAGLKVVSGQAKLLEDYLETAKAHSQSTIDYLNEPQNVMPRSGGIAIGGLAGFIFAARGGFIKKVLFTTAGAGAIASLCYPRQAEQFAHDALFEARKGFAIAYNFVNGVKPGEEVPVDPISKFPVSLEEVKFLLYDLYDEAKEMVMSSKNK